MHRLLLLASPVIFAGCKKERISPDPCCASTDSGGGDDGSDDGDDGSSGDCPEASGTDALVHQGRASTSSFFETTDVKVFGATPELWACTGVQGLQVFELSDPESPVQMAELSFDGSSAVYPRCQYLAWDGDDRVLVSAHIDEIQETPWVGLVDRSDATEPIVVGSWSSTSWNLEEVDWHQGQAVVTAHDDGLVILDVSDDGLSEAGRIEGLGNAHRVVPFDDDGLAVGTVDGELHLLDAAREVQGSLSVGSGIQDLLAVGEGRLVVALGAGGMALIDVSDPADPVLLHSIDTHGAAIKLSQLGTGEVVVANWSDVRVYRVIDDAFALHAVDDVLDAGSDPRIMAAGASGELVVAGEWSGLHVYAYDDAGTGPEITHDRRLKVAADGTDQRVLLDISNEGDTELSIAKVFYPDGWSGDEAPLTIAAGESTTWDLSLEGTEDLSYEDLSFCTDDPDEGTSVVTLQVGSRKLTVGDEASDFSAVDVLTGEVLSLSDYRGEVVLLAYFATF